MAALTASEATIYGRWGFGAATFRKGVEVDTSPGFGFRDFTDPGRVELVEPADAWPHVKAVFDTFHARQRGSVEWPSPYEDMHTGAFDFDERRRQPQAPRRRAPRRRPARSTASCSSSTARRTRCKVDEMVALTPQAAARPSGRSSAASTGSTR